MLPAPPQSSAHCNKKSPKFKSMCSPQWFFADSQAEIRNYIPTRSDIGIIQKNPMEMDIPATERAVSDFLAALDAKAVQTGALLREQTYDLVACDISPLGIQAAQSAGIPSLLFENFTWDWIYQPFTAQHPAFQGIIRELAAIYSSVENHCQLIPFCGGVKGGAHIIHPVSREPRQDPVETRRRLGIQPGEKMGLISMGGIPNDFENITSQATVPQDVKLVIPGNFTAPPRHPAITILPHRSGFYHPDLVAAADFVIGKAGYSTIAEVSAQRTPFGYLLRDDFRESEDFRGYLQDQDFTVEISREHFESFDLAEDIARLSALQPSKGQLIPTNGASEAADFILQTLLAA